MAIVPTVLIVKPTPIVGLVQRQVSIEP